MNKTQLFKQLSSLIFLIFILNSLANKFYWYFSIWWSDMPMHFLGGFWLGLCFIWIFSFKDISTQPNFSFFSQTLFFVLIVGISWELFEFYFINYLAQNSFNTLDTVSDIFFDLSGGAFAILYFLRKVMRTHENEIQLK